MCWKILSLQTAIFAKIVIAGNAESLTNIDDPSVSICDRGPKSRLTQSQSDIVPSPQMLLNKRIPVEHP